LQVKHRFCGHLIFSIIPRDIRIYGTIQLVGLNLEQKMTDRYKQPSTGTIQPIKPVWLISTGTGIPPSAALPEQIHFIPIKPLLM